MKEATPAPRNSAQGPRNADTEKAPGRFRRDADLEVEKARVLRELTSRGFSFSYSAVVCLPDFSRVELRQLVACNPETPGRVFPALDSRPGSWNSIFGLPSGDPACPIVSDADRCFALCPQIAEPRFRGDARVGRVSVFLHYRPLASYPKGRYLLVFDQWPERRPGKETAVAELGGGDAENRAALRRYPPAAVFPLGGEARA